MVNLKYFSGTVTMISDIAMGQNGEGEGCYKLVSADNGGGSLVNFVVIPSTYVVDQAMLTTGDKITGYYDGNAPVPLIYPPQYRALVMVKHNPYLNVKADFFDSQLISSDALLKLNISPFTQIVLTNGQSFTKEIANQNLIAIYGPSTKSIPAQTTPYKIIVLCL